jgi:hypothetical protein
MASQRDREVTTTGTNGTLTATGSTTLTGGHVIPIAMVLDTSAWSAYLLTNLMGVDTNMGAEYGYWINSAGELVPDMAETNHRGPAAKSA